jgi:hypothetical protein
MTAETKQSDAHSALIGMAETKQETPKEFANNLFRTGSVRLAYESQANAIDKIIKYTQEFECSRHEKEIEEMRAYSWRMFKREICNCCPEDFPCDTCRDKIEFERVFGGMKQTQQVRNNGVHRNNG